MTNHDLNLDSARMSTTGVWRLLRSYPGARFLALTFAAVSTVASLAEAGTIALVAAVALAVASDDEVGLDFGAVDLGSTTVAGALWIGLCAVGLVGLARVLAAYFAARLSTLGIVHSRLLVLGSFLETSWEVQESERAGHVHELASMHAARVSQTFHMLASFIMAAVGFTVLTIGAAVASPIAAASMLALTGVVTAVLRPIVQRTRRESKDHLTEHNRVITAIEEATEVTAELRVFGVTTRMQERVRQAVLAVARPHLRTRFLSLVVPGLMTSATLGALIGGLAVISALSVDEPLGVGVAMLFLLRNMRYAQGAQAAAQLIVELSPFLEELRESNERYRSAVAPVRGTMPLEAITSIELMGVEYWYPNGEHALRGIDMTIAAGEVIGVVGPSGGGKTTLVQIMLGLRAPTIGKVMISGTDLSDIRPDDWHALVAYVGQSPRLISGDVRDNVRFFRPTITDEDVEEALVAAALSTDLVDWDARARAVGESGRELSGGQRQRIALARAFAGHPQFVVLDEPTSALDVTSERHIQTALEQLADDVTVVLVAHRPSTLTVCDRLFVMERGEVREVARPVGEVEASLLLSQVTGGQP